MTSPALSIVIIGYRNRSTLVSAVESVSGDEAAEGEVELVVVTSADDSGASEVRAALPDVRVEHSSTRLLPGGARNLGVACTIGDHVAFLEGDCRAAPGWVSGRLAAHRDERVAVAGAVGLDGAHTPWAIASWLLSYCNRLEGLPAGVVPAADPRAHGLSLRREVLDAVGPFDEGIRIGEDTLMAQALARAGHEIWFDPSIRTDIRGPRSSWSFLADEFRRGRRLGIASVGLEAAGLAAPPGSSWRNARHRATTAWVQAHAHTTLSPRQLRPVKPFLVAGAVARSLGQARAALRKC